MGWEYSCQFGSGIGRITANKRQIETRAVPPHGELVIGVERKDDECLSRNGHSSTEAKDRRASTAGNQVWRSSNDMAWLSCAARSRDYRLLVHLLIHARRAIIQTGNGK